MNKIKQVVSAFTLALATLLVPMASLAASVEGNIRSIYAIDEKGELFTSTKKTLVAGEKIYLLVRLLNKDYQLGKDSQSWYFNPNPMRSKVAGELMDRPKLAVSVGGRECYAEYSDYGPGVRESGRVEKYPEYTDLYFVYTVQTGDYAWPVKLFQRDGSISDTQDDFKIVNAGTLRYFDVYGDQWQLTNAGGDLCDFEYGEEFPSPALPMPQPWPDSREHRTFDLVSEQVHVKTIDFESHYDVESDDDSKSIWRYVYPNMYDVVQLIPSITCDGDGAKGSVTYVWSADPTVFQVVPADYDPSREPEENGLRVYEVSGQKVWVLPLPLSSGKTTAEFRLLGRSEVLGKDAMVVMSPYEGNVYSAVGTRLDTSKVLTRRVVVKDPPPPTVSIEFTEQTVSISTNFEGVATTMMVRISPMAKHDVTVELTANLQNVGALGSIFEENILGLNKTLIGDAYKGRDREVTIPAGVSAVPVYVFALGYTPETAQSDKGIQFLPKVISDESEYPEREQARATEIPTTLCIRHNKNSAGAANVTEVEVPDTIASGREAEITVFLADYYRNIIHEENVIAAGDPGTYSFVFEVDGEKYSSANGDFDYEYEGDGEFTLYPVFELPSGEDYVAKLTVQGELNTHKMTRDDVVLSVGKSPTLTATIPDMLQPIEIAEGEQLPVSFALEGGTSKKETYAFLKPMTEIAKACVDTNRAPFNAGVPIAKNEREAQLKPFVRFTDGTDNSTLQFHAVLSGDSLDIGKKIAGFDEGSLYITVTNVEPRVTSTEVNGYLVGDGETVEKSVPRNVKTSIRVQATDVPADLNHDGFLTKLVIHDGASATIVWNNNPNDHVFEYEFKNPTDGTDGALVEVYLKDKDMADYPSVPNRTFRVQVGSAPQVTLSYGNEMDTGVWSEREPLEGIYHSVIVGLTVACPSNLEIKVNAPRAADGGRICFLQGRNVRYDAENDCYVVSLKAGQLNEELSVVELDGTPLTESAGVEISAEVTTEDMGDYGKKWKDFYEQSNTLRTRVVNVAPVPRTPMENAPTNENQRAFSAIDVKYCVQSDVINDLTNGIRVAVSVDGEDQADLTNTVYDTATYKFEKGVTFTTPGVHSVTVTFTDKDDGSVSRTLWYVVLPTKTMNVRAHAPAGQVSAPNRHSIRYGAAPGLGQGRILGVGLTELQSVKSWAYNFSVSVTESSYDVSATGYKAEEEDALIDAKGNFPKAGGNYKNPLGLDSYFYAWVCNNAKDSDGVEIKSELMIDPGETGTLAIPLQDYDKEKIAYDAQNWEAVFAKEYLWSDNCGDINGDGIPDVYAAFPNWQGKFTDIPESSNGELNGNDLTPIATFNDDGDFLPLAESSRTGALVPGVSGTGFIEDRPFTAILEIRGYDEGLNGLGRVGGFTPERVYEVELTDESGETYMGWDKDRCTISELEYMAWKESGKTEEEWSPECPTDPTVEDTDSDGFSDGYEYFFWYRAHVGYLENGVHKYLTGRRYDPLNPGEPQTITATEIENLMNPQIAAGEASAAGTRDSDNDGLTDLEEFELGTNPFDFDTDGDGLPDGYEAMFEEMDPLVWGHAEKNPDGDVMAELGEIKMNDIKMTAIGLADGDGVSYYGSFGVHTTVGEAPLGSDGTVVRTADGDFLTTLPVQTVKIGGKTVLVGDYDGEHTWRCESIGDSGYMISAKAALTRGTPVTEVVGDGDRTYFENVVESVEGDVWEVWRYGIDGDFVRCRKIDDPASLVGRRVVMLGGVVKAIHWHVYDERGFDPRTGWLHPCPESVDSRLFTNYDEFLSMTFLVREGVIDASDLTPNRTTTLQDIWAKFATNPVKADTDDDGMPDGWELYVMRGIRIYSPIDSFELLTDADARSRDMKGGLEDPEEFSGIASCAEYADCPTIVCRRPDWRNKKWPTDPWNKDTDGDGMNDKEEGEYFIYSGDGEAGGGLNPLSWDTDRDGLPDPWEAEFAGTYNVGTSKTETTTSVNEDGTTNTTTNVKVEGNGWNNDGMDGTVDDRYLDYDHDGLANWQEYMVGAMRCWRYDDTVSTWGNLAFDAAKIPGGEGEAWNEYWYSRLVDKLSPDYNPNLVDGQFDGVQAYFSLATNRFEQVTKDPKTCVLGHYYMFRDGIYHDLAEPTDPRCTSLGANRFTLAAKKAENQILGYLNRPSDGRPIYPVKYITCNPCRHDTDNDGMDDHWEVFHGLNPLLGTAGSRDGDVIFDAYFDGGDGPWSALDNYWYLNPPRPPRVKDPGLTRFDFDLFPWLTGLATSDVDGDNIRNQQEAILPKVQAASTYLHTDPTPLWLTDSSYALSLTRRYYRAGMTPVQILNLGTGGFTHLDESGAERTYSFGEFPQLFAEGGIVTIGYDFSVKFGVGPYQWSFEENEGYDSDHDYLSDFEEAQGKTKSASDPQDSDDPLRRQAMYFNGVDAFLQTPLEEAEVPGSAAAGAEARQNFLYYTVECWVKPDAEALAADGETRVLVERAIYTGDANPGDEKYLRKNFQIGVRNGRWYTKFDSTGTDSSQQIEITNGPGANTDWAHVAATYDGTALCLYVNGICYNKQETSVQPEHGVASLTTTASGEMDGGYTWFESSILVGAGARTRNGITFDSAYRGGLPTTRNDYAGFFKGYIDEVRIWDGARAASDILSDYKARKRYTRDDAIENRLNVYANWLNGATRSPVSVVQLPPQLMYHYSFDHVAGAIDAADVIKVPAGFGSAMTVTDAKAPWSRPEGWTCPWLDSIHGSIASTVFTDHSWVPWVNDTVSHLPRLDRTTVDSVYWSEDYAGYTSAAEAGYESYAFPRTAELYGKWVQIAQSTRWNLVAEDDALSKAYRFTLRDRNVTGSDLLPFGGAYPRRISSDEGGMWDEQGASDAWAENGLDSDNNGLPDWWEEYARNNYCEDLDPEMPLQWDTTVSYNGVAMTAWQAYLRDLANGLVKDGESVGIPTDADGNAIYADTRDVDADGLPDWWEELYGVQTYSVEDGDADPDNDGLSNYAEYMLSEVYPVAYDLEAAGCEVTLLDPKKAYSKVGQGVPDYFLAYSDEPGDISNPSGRAVFAKNEYFGEIATDHDFMENWWEKKFAKAFANPKTYDPRADRDEDGWSNFAECRASLWGGYFDAELIDRWTGLESDQYVKCYPEPIVGVRATYHGNQEVSGKPLVIRMTTGQTPRMDATFVVPSEVDAQTRYIGPFRADVTLRGHLSPGSVNANSIVFERALVSSDSTYSWNWDWYDENGLPHPMTTRGSFDDYRMYYIQYPHIELNGADLAWEPFTTIIERDNGTAEVFGTGVKMGTVNTVTGEYALDMTKLGSDWGNYVFRVTYTSRIGYEWPQTVYVSDTKELASASGAGLAGSGRLREGRNTLEAFLDLDGDGAFTEGEPYGVVRNVSVGWHKVPEIVVELRDESPVMTAIQLAAGTGEDRKVTILVAREQINDLPLFRTISKFEVITDDRPYLTEGDVITTLTPDLDWNWLNKDAKKAEISKIVSAVYSVSEIVDQGDACVTNLLKVFTKTFPSDRPVAIPVAPMGSEANPVPVYSASPTFAFAVPEGVATAYRLQIRRRNATTNDYDSGVLALPGRVGSTVGSAVCEVTPPVYVDDAVYSGTTTNRAVFADGEAYEWRVALYNAKFNDTVDNTDASAEWSAWAGFEMDVANENRYPKMPTGYGNATLAVRYYGPAACPSGSIVVEAYESADFSGQPLAQIRLADLSALGSREDVKTPNAVLRGLKPGEVYFRAFYDQNDNGSRDKWESWGYANQVGTGFKAIYNPDPLTVTASPADWKVGGTADRVIYIEDCDANQNEYPDCLEPEEFPESSGGGDDPDDPDPASEKISWWDWAAADPEDAADGDVMAYYETEMYLVTVKNGDLSATYLLEPGQEVPVSGTPAERFRLASWYAYGESLYGYGLPAAAEDLEGMVVYGAPEKVKVAFVHAQVREKFGFSSDTAVPQGKTNTKPFTALDKYYVLYYLEATGRLNAIPPTGFTSFAKYVMESGDVKLYEKWTLRPLVCDNDYDGIYDGWELYVDAKPLDFSDREDDADGDGVPLWREYDLDVAARSAHASDPVSRDSDGDGVGDADYHDFLLWDAGGDADGDGLSNYAEYLITRFFKYAVLDPRNPKTDGDCIDYFRKIGHLYLGEVFTDHDQVGDVWEGAHAKAANRYAYDPARDDDGDGWSNWAEAKAGTDPTLVTIPSIDNQTLGEYPVPCIKATVSYHGKAAATGPIVIKAWNEKTDPKMEGIPDAVWTIAGEAAGAAEDGGKQQGTDSMSAATSSKFVGIRPSGRRTFNLGPGAIERGSVSIFYKDLDYLKANVTVSPSGDGYFITDTKIPDSTTAAWYKMAKDREGVLYTVGGVFAGEVKVGTVDYTTGRVEIDFDAQYMTGAMLGDPSSVADLKSGSQSGSETDSWYDLLNLDQSYVNITWISRAASGAVNQTFYLSDADAVSGGTSGGHVREGLNTFVAFVDNDGNGAYTAGEPYGFVGGVDVGWDGAQVEIGLTEASPVFARVNLFDGTSDRLAIWGADSGDVAGEGLLPLSSNDTWKVAEGVGVHVRVVPYLVAGVAQDQALYADQRQYKELVQYVQNRVVAEFDMNLATKPVLTEADFIRDGEFDIDWADFRSQIVNNGQVNAAVGQDVTAVKYRIILGRDGAIGRRGNLDTTTAVTAFPTLIERRFEPAGSRTKPTELKVTGADKNARPTFSWRLREPTTASGYAAPATMFGTSYTAFEIQVFDEDGALVWDSGVRRAPACDAEQTFTWQADLFAGDQTALGKVFGPGSYTWRVAMYNAKFKPTTRESENGWSAKVAFSNAVGTQQESSDGGRGAIDVAVKYTGPELVLASCEDVTTSEGMVRVQAFANADFAGTPAAEGFVSDKVALTDVKDVTANGRLIGLEPGTYWVRAYVDSNGNFRKDDWESWGAAKQAVTVAEGVIAPLAGLYIEDADTDQDWLPDAWEMAKYGSLGAKGAEIDPEGRIVIKQEIYDGAIADKAGVSRILPGVTLEFFQSLGNVQLLLPGYDADVTQIAVPAICEAVERKIVEGTLKITSLTVDATTGKAYLTVGAKATDSIAGMLISPVYTIPAKSEVTLKVFKKATLAEQGWPEEPEKTVTVQVGEDLRQTVEVDLGEDLSSGYYKVEIEQ